MAFLWVDDKNKPRPQNVMHKLGLRTQIDSSAIFILLSGLPELRTSLYLHEKSFWESQEILVQILT